VSQEQPSYQLKFECRSTSLKGNERDTILSVPKPEYQGQDFFHRQEFRGLLLADHQDALGPSSFARVEDMNKTTVSQFQHLQGFRNAILRSRQVKQYYEDQSKEGSINRSCREKRTNSMSIQSRTLESSRHVDDETLSKIYQLSQRSPLTSHVVGGKQRRDQKLDVSGGKGLKEQPSQTAYQNKRRFHTTGEVDLPDI
jgi:hypothetical protein